MTVREALSDVRAIWALFAAAVTAAAFLAGYAQLPAQVHDLREWKVNTAEPVMRFLACSQIAENEGRNAKECEVLLQGLNDILRRPM